MTKTDLLELHSHELQVRVWNSLDKMSMRARFDRPKAFRLPAPSRQGAEQRQVEAEDSEGLTSGSCRPERLSVVHQEKTKTKRRRRTKQLSDGEEGEDSEPQEHASPSNKRDPAISIVTEENEGGGGGGGVETSKMRDIHADAFSLSDPGRLALSSTLNLSASHDEDLSLSASSALKGTCSWDPLNMSKSIIILFSCRLSPHRTIQEEAKTTANRSSRAGQSG